MQDIVEHGARTKATRYATHTFLTVYATSIGPQVSGSIDSRLLTGRVSIFLLPAGVVTVRHESDPSRPIFDIDEVVRRWDDNSDLLRRGSPALLHGILDVVIDEQFDTIQQLDDGIEALEDALFDDRSQTRQLQRDTYRLRKELVELRRIVLPMREVVNTVMRRVSPGSQGSELDGGIQIFTTTQSGRASGRSPLRDMVTTVFETNLSAGRPTQHHHEEADRLGGHHRRADPGHRLVRPEHPYPGYGNNWECGPARCCRPSPRWRSTSVLPGAAGSDRTRPDKPLDAAVHVGRRRYRSPPPIPRSRDAGSGDRRIPASITEGVT